MEVAVNAFRLNLFRKQNLSVVLLAAGLCSGLSGGCTDFVTFSKQSHDQGMEYYNQKDYANAAGAFRNAVRQVPNDYQDHYYLAQSLAAQGQWEQAIHSYYDAWEVMGIDDMGRLDNKLKYQVLDGLANAIASSDTRDSYTNQVEAKAHSRQSADDYLLLAKIYVDRRDADSAIDAYDRAAMIEPDNFYIAKAYGLYLEHLGQNDKAAVPLRRAYAMNGNDQQVADALRAIGIIPGPSIKEEDALAKPLIPKGPIPEVDLGKAMGIGGSATPASSTQAPQD
jgi:Tfp pilus assembly protein PilF